MPIQTLPLTDAILERVASSLGDAADLLDGLDEIALAWRIGVLQDQANLLRRTGKFDGIDEALLEARAFGAIR
jgi:hypothetical protein